MEKAAGEGGDGRGEVGNTNKHDRSCVELMASVTAVRHVTVALQRSTARMNQHL